MLYTGRIPLVRLDFLHVKLVLFKNRVHIVLNGRAGLEKRQRYPLIVGVRGNTERCVVVSVFKIDLERERK